MEVTLYLPYYDYNDSAFDADSNYYSEEEYIKAMSKEYKKNKDIVYNSMIDYNNGSGSLVQGIDGQTYKFGAKTPQNEEKVAYSASDGELYDENGESDTVDNLITHFVDMKPFVEMMEFDDSSCEEEFITEVSLWFREHNSINKYKDFKGEEWTWVNEPKRNIKIKFKNKANEILHGVLENCKIMDIVDGKTAIVLVERFRLIDSLES